MVDILSPSPEVASALSEGRPVVALESSVWVQGLPWPHNWEAAQEVQNAVREEGATPAVLWLEDGLIHVGLSPATLQALCQSPRGSKLNVADLPVALANRQAGATTVSASLRAAELMGLKVFATGGIGGVHRNWQDHPDISADLLELSRSPVITVCAGVKSVLDIAATLEALETLAIPVYRFGCDAFPEFYTPGNHDFGTRLDSPEAIANTARYSRQILGRAGLVVQNPPTAMDPKQLALWLEEGLRQAPRGGKAVTPFLLSWLGKASGGQTLDVNRQLLVANARLAAQISHYLID